MTRVSRRAWRVGAIFCTAALIAAGCGDDDDGDTASTGAPATTAGGAASTEAAATTAASTTGAPRTTTAGTAAPGSTAAGSTAAGTTGAEPSGSATGTPVTIGVVYSETGRTGAAYNASDDVAKAWAEWVNTEKGGVGGHPVTIAAGDSLSTGEGAAGAGREVVEGSGAIAVVINDSTAETAMVQYLTDQGVPYIGGSANNRPRDGAGTPWPNLFFHQAPSSPTTSVTTMYVAAKDGQESFGAMVCSEVPVCAEADGLFSGLAGPLGIEYTGFVTVGAADPSFAAPCLELIGKGTTALNMGIAPATIRSVVDECQTQGFDGTYTSSYNSVVVSDLREIEGIRMIGGFNGFPWWADDPQVQQFRDVMDAAGFTGYETPAATSTWAALELFRKVMNDDGPPADATVTSADVIALYQQISNETLGGLLPQPITYSADGPQPLVKCFWPFLFEDGEVSTLTTDDPSGNGAEGDLKTICPPATG